MNTNNQKRNNNPTPSRDGDVGKMLIQGMTDERLSYNEKAPILTASFTYIIPQRGRTQASEIAVKVYLVTR